MKKSWVVKVRVTEEQEIITDECTEHEAKEYPFSKAVETRTLSTLDCEVLSVKPNE